MIKRGLNKRGGGASKILWLSLPKRFCNQLAFVWVLAYVPFTDSVYLLMRHCKMFFADFSASTLGPYPYLQTTYCHLPSWPICLVSFHNFLRLQICFACYIFWRSITLLMWQIPHCLREIHLLSISAALVRLSFFFSAAAAVMWCIKTVLKTPSLSDKAICNCPLALRKNPAFRDWCLF